jgi:hypothetical protein
MIKGMGRSEVGKGEWGGDAFMIFPSDVLALVQCDSP